MDAFVATILFKYERGAWDSFYQDTERAGRSISNVDRRVSGLRGALTGITKTFLMFRTLTRMGHLFSEGFVKATKEARNFEYALLDIKKVAPHIDLKQAKKEILEVAKYAPGRDIAKDIAPAYKRAVQELNDQSRIHGFMKMTEMASRAYDMTAEETAQKLGIINANYLRDRHDLSGDEKNKALWSVANKIAYAHHTHGNAMVPDILRSFADASGILSTNKISDDFAIAVLTNLINAGSRPETASKLFRRLIARLVKFTDPVKGNRSAGIDESFAKLGLDRKTFANTMRQNGDQGLMVFFKSLQDYYSKTGDIKGIVTPIIGQYAMEEGLKATRDFGHITKLYKQLQGKEQIDGGGYLTNEYIPNAYNTIMQSVEMQKQRAQTSLQQARIKVGEGMLPVVQSFYTALKDLGEAVASQDWGPLASNAEYHLENTKYVRAAFVKLGTGLVTLCKGIFFFYESAVEAINTLMKIPFDIGDKIKNFMKNDLTVENYKKALMTYHNPDLSWGEKQNAYRFIRRFKMTRSKAGFGEGQETDEEFERRKEYLASGAAAEEEEQAKLFYVAKKGSTKSFGSIEMNKPYQNAFEHANAAHQNELLTSGEHFTNNLITNNNADYANHYINTQAPKNINVNINQNNQFNNTDSDVSTKIANETLNILANEIKNS